MITWYYYVTKDGASGYWSQNPPYMVMDRPMASIVADAQPHRSPFEMQQDGYIRQQKAKGIS